MINSKIKVEVANGTEVIDVTQLVQKVEWSGSYNQACRKLTFSLLASAYDKNIPNIPINCGNVIRFYEEGKELFRGYVQSKDISYNSNSINYMALDGGTYVLRNELVYNFKDKSAEEITQQVCEDLGVPTGEIATTGEKMDKKFFGKGGYDIIMTGYTYASTKTNKKYMCLMKEGKLNIIKKGDIVLDIGFENGSNITESDFSEDISSMVNKVKVYNGDEQFVKEISNDEDMKMYGTFAKVLKQEDGKDADAEAKNILTKIERKASIEGFGDTSCITGYGVKVKDEYTGLVGLFYIDEDSHSWEAGVHKIKLTLAFENMMHEVDAEDKENESSGVGGEGGSNGGSGREVDAEFTAYYPSNDPMQGGFKAANGETLEPSKNTCAAPKDVPFNTNIKVLNTGTSQDNKTFRVNDRGGAIKVVNGVYKIDLLMSNRKEAYAFGRRKGKAIIMDGSGSSGGSAATGGNQKIVEYAKSKLGCKYVWGATGPNTFDCSGLTGWCHKQVGITIPRVSGDQRRGGKSISKENALPGDIICFEGHVGLYVGNGQMIHAPNKRKPVKYDPCFSGHYGSRLLAVRRYW